MIDDLISRQAAIDAFDGHFAIVGRNSAERFKMYIEAVINDIRKLPPAQPEPCEDAVSRKAVQYLLAYFVNKDKYDDACDGLKHLPSVTPKQRKKILYRHYKGDWCAIT